MVIYVWEICCILAMGIDMLFIGSNHFQYQFVLILMVGENWWMTEVTRDCVVTSALYIFPCYFNNDWRCVYWKRLEFVGLSPLLKNSCLVTITIGGAYTEHKQDLFVMYRASISFKLVFKFSIALFSSALFL